MSDCTGHEKHLKWRFKTLRAYLSLFTLTLLYTQGLFAYKAIEHDPTQPLANVTLSPHQKKPPYVVQSIVISPTRRLALINYRLVKVGDRVGAGQVLSIDKNVVVMSVPEGKLSVYFIDHRSISFSS